MNSHTKQRPKGSKKNPLEVMKLQLKRGKTSELGSAGARQLEKRESGGEGGREMVVKTWKIPLEPAPEGIAGLSSEGLLWGAAVLLGKEQGWVVWGGLQGSPLCPPSQQGGLGIPSDGNTWGVRALCHPPRGWGGLIQHPTGTGEHQSRTPQRRRLQFELQEAPFLPQNRAGLCPFCPSRGGWHLAGEAEHDQQSSAPGSAREKQDEIPAWPWSWQGAQGIQEQPLSPLPPRATAPAKPRSRRRDPGILQALPPPGGNT